MSVLPIVTWPDARLTQVCAPVERVDDALRALADDMLETMYAAPGRGLAAPQVGRLVRLFVMDPTWKDGTPAPVVMVNPEIVARSDEHGAMEEGCLSIPGAPATVVRPLSVTMRWTDLGGAEASAELSGFAARCAQHELDHLNGVLILDRIPAGDRARIEAVLRGAAPA